MFTRFLVNRFPLVSQFNPIPPRKIMYVTCTSVGVHRYRIFINYNRMRKRCVYKFQRYYITTTEPGIKRGVRYTPPLTLSAYNPTRRVFFCVGRQSQSIELRLCLMFNVQNVQRLPIPIWRV